MGPNQHLLPVKNKPKVCETDSFYNPKDEDRIPYDHPSGAYD
jgi:hypothetical protein